MAQVRVTLVEDYGKPVVMQYGHEVVVPMSFHDSPAPEAMTSFRAGVRPLPAQARRWHLDWNNQELRSTLMPVEVAMHYFGNWHARNDQEWIEQFGLRATFNAEQERVAKIWGDYGFYLQAGPYANVRIREPRVPQVTIQNVNENGSTVGEWVFKPQDHFKWSAMLDPRAAEYREEDDAMFNPTTARDKLVSGLDIDAIVKERVDRALAELRKAK